MAWIESDYSSETAMRFARSGARVRIAAADDACPVCKAMAQRAYLPSDAPRLPIRGCLHDQCRCTFEAIDPETDKSVPELVRWGARLLKQGQHDKARRLLRRATELDERYELGWLWLSGAVEDQQKIACLEKVLEINPHSQIAKAGLDLLHRGLDPLSATASAPYPAGHAISPTGSQSRPQPQADQEVVSPLVPAIRDERQVILRQWEQFVRFAVSMDAEMMLIQARAFVRKLDALDEQELTLIPPDLRQEEVELQHRELAGMIGALRQAFEGQQFLDRAEPGEQAIGDAVEHLVQQVRTRQTALLDRFSAADNSASGQ